jgi:hypothetical protein
MTMRQTAMMGWIPREVTQEVEQLALNPHPRPRVKMETEVVARMVPQLMTYQHRQKMIPVTMTLSITSFTPATLSAVRMA